ncbi:MAG: dipeptidase [Planctomycetes bacterium]|nr:dipeptidase [Planctomycetota bacterium]
MAFLEWGEDARRLVAERPVFDAHADSLQRALDLGHDLGARGPGHLDLERGRQGGLGALVFVSWVDPKFIDAGPHGARDRTRGLLGEFHRLIERHPEAVGFAGNGVAADSLRRSGRVAGIPGIEGGHSIEESLDELEWFFERGVRVMTLVWNNHLSWIRSCQPGAGSHVPEGLSEFGRSVVRRMNRLGMVVDLSHAGERSFYDTLEVATAPVIASHSGCKAICDHQRNLTDDQLRALARQGGVVGIVFCMPFLSRAAGAEDQRLRETPGYKALADPNSTLEFLRQSDYLQLHAAPLEADVVVDHICHAVEVAGIDHVGLGSDYDGIQRTPRGLEGAECYGTLAELLLRRGFSVQDVRKVLGLNMQRVFAAATGPGTRAATQGLVSLSTPPFVSA